MNHQLFPPEFLALLELELLPAIRSSRRQRPGRHTGGATGDSQEFQDFRAYIPGDDLRYLDWNIFRRSRKLFLRRYRLFPEVVHGVTLDTSASIRFSPQRAFTAWRVAALLGAQLLAGGDRVRLYAGSAAETGFAPGPDAVWRWCEALSAVFTQGEDNAALRFRTPLRGRHWVISDFYDPAGLDHLESRLRHAAFVPVRIYDAEEENPAMTEPLCLVDAESRERILIAADAALYERYIEQWRRFEGLLEQVGVRSSARLFRVRTTESVDELYERYRRELFVPEI